MATSKKTKARREKKQMEYIKKQHEASSSSLKKNKDKIRELEEYVFSFVNELAAWKARLPLFINVVTQQKDMMINNGTANETIINSCDSIVDVINNDLIPHKDDFDESAKELLSMVGKMKDMVANVDKYAVAHDIIGKLNALAVEFSSIENRTRGVAAMIQGIGTHINSPVVKNDTEEKSDETNDTENVNTEDGVKVVATEEITLEDIANRTKFKKPDEIKIEVNDTVAEQLVKEHTAELPTNDSAVVVDSTTSAVTQ